MRCDSQHAIKISQSLKAMSLKFLLGDNRRNDSVAYRSVILEDVGGGMSGVERVLLALRVEGSDRREASDDYT